MGHPSTASERDALSPDDRSVLKQDDIRHFFAKRTWLRPADWEQLKAGEPLPKSRIKHLSTWVKGYLCAKS